MKMRKVPVVAIIDIGKTNKKMILFDESYTLVYEQTFQFQEIYDEDGEACEDIAAIRKCIDSFLTAISSKFDVKAINVSAYGASLIYLDQEGALCTPLYSYLKTYPESLKNQFYTKHGDEHSFSKQTASPALGSLNSGMQLYRLKYMQPEIFSRVKYALHLPQYFIWILTGMAFSEITSIGCHTGLWDFEKSIYHDWVYDEDIADRLPKLLPSDQALVVTLNNKKIYVGSGLHDTSAALIPYQKCFIDPFILLSTGTWCISINPFNQTPLTDDELKRDCLLNLSYKGKPVKVSRLFAGYEHEQYTLKLAKHFNVAPDYYKNIEFGYGLINTLQTSHFDAQSFSADQTYGQAYHQFMAHIVHQQASSTRLIMDDLSRVTNIYVDGGFSKNVIYMQLLAMAFPELKVYAACIPQASALGAALALHQYWNNNPIVKNLIDLKYYPAYQFLCE